MEGENKVIVLAGMIGTGKTTYTKYISEYYGSEAFFESVDDNPVLERFYEDKEKWGFALQIHFLNTRFRSIKDAFRHQNNVLDRSIYEDALFTKINNEQGNIKDEEMNIYLSLLDNMMEELEGLPKKAPDLLVYLKGSFEKVMEHIKKRGRDYEQTPEQVDYFRLLHSRYDDWFEEYNYGPKIAISIDEWSIEDPEQRPIILNMIDEELKRLREEEENK